MKFLAIEKSAVAAMISERSAQSTDFALGERISRLLTRDAGVETNGPLGKARAVAHKGGVYLIGPAPQTDRALIFDFEACDPFEEDARRSLTVLQKTLRLAVKVWEGLSFSPAEHSVSDTKTVVFPFGYGTSSGYRISVERIREGQADHLLVYRCGHDEGRGPDEQPLQGIFNRAGTGLEDATGKASAHDSVERQIDFETAALGVTALVDEPPSHIPMALPFDNWLHFLTERQKEFVLANSRGPRRLEGPAGTGKTLCLILRAIHGLRMARDAGREHHSIFLTHSAATRNAIAERFRVMDPDCFTDRTRVGGPQSLTIQTLQDWAGEKLGQNIQEVEYLDRDAMASKEMQLLHITEAVDAALESALPSHKPFLSDKFLHFLETEDRWSLSEMLQHEIAVVIKGRAGEDLERYKELPMLRYNLPLMTEEDKGFAFIIYQDYARRLSATGHFDTDDIVLSAAAQLDTPIWRRRRQKEGFDEIFVDETHLFNMNELLLIHYLTKDPTVAPPIYFTIDRAQAVGDRTISDRDVETGLLPNYRDAVETDSVNAVFRSSPDIVNLALSVTASGATLFTNFADPLANAESTFTSVDEKKASRPVFRECPNDEEMIETAFSLADDTAKAIGEGRSAVAVIAFSPDLLKKLEDYAKKRNRHAEVLRRRGDLETVHRAKARERFVLAAPEYVGGLEFGGVVLVGVDAGRVPPIASARTAESKSFLRYAAHNNLYVAITRAKFRVVALGTSERGESDLLSPAINQDLIDAERVSTPKRAHP